MLADHNTCAWTTRYSDSTCMLFVMYTVRGEVSVAPTYYVAAVGQTITIDCRTTAEDTVLWLKKNTTESRYQLITNSGDGEVLEQLRQKYTTEKLSGFLYRLTIVNIQESDEGYVMCKQSNSDHDTASVKLTVTGMAAH